MLFDSQNPINQLCARGMQLEGEAEPEEAAKLFMQAWNEAINSTEKFIAAHYLARHQNTIEDKLKWDETALSLALELNNPEVNGAFPSLYLNVAKCYEDLKDFDRAAENYQSALEYAKSLPQDGYSNMIRSGVKSGIERVQASRED
jgi:tetratricopeptide (TPR) repeat protein